MKHTLFNILACFLLLCPASAEELPPLNFKGLYEFQFSGVPFGRMGIEVKESAQGHTITSDIASSGIVNLFTRHKSHTTVNATDNELIYDTNYQTKKKKKAVKLVYKDRKIIKEVIVPPENPAKRPPVPAAQKNAAYDPLSFSLALRKKIGEALKTGKNEFTLNLFDGRRLSEVNVAIAGRKTIPYGNNEKTPVIKLAVRRKLLAGFTQSELADYDPKEPTLWMYYSDDERLVPLKVEVGFLFGKITGLLAKECATDESCLLGLRE